MSYVVYDDNGILKVKSKCLAKQLGLSWIITFKSFYDALDYIHDIKQGGE